MAARLRKIRMKEREGVRVEGKRQKDKSGGERKKEEGQKK